MPFVLTSRTALNGAAYDHAARCNARNGEVGIKQVAPWAERLTCDHVNAQAPANRQIEVARKRRAPGVGLHLDVVPGQGNAIEAQAADARDHRGAGSVLEDEAQAVLFGSQAFQVGEPLREIARKLWPRAWRGEGGGHPGTQPSAVGPAPAHPEGSPQPLNA